MRKEYFILPLLIIVLNSCDLLSTREPEEPKSAGLNFITPTTPDLLFQNLKSSVEEKILENYLACFVDSTFLNKRYTFISSGSSTVLYPILSSWGISSERQYFNNLIVKIQSGSSISLKYSNVVNTPLGDSAVYSFDYTLTVNSSNTSIAGEYQGSSRFKIFLDSRNQWAIGEWQDSKKDNFACWSDLKGRTY
ncbi:MAG: hypothetical protein HYS25_06405 [Ignavibacteriales bacterium]|nr:hypothetical protein [Ignavibacteriales bacterium]